MPYRGDPAQLFSNRYYFDGGAPGSSSVWEGLFDAWTALERALWDSSVHIVHASGYGPSSEVAVASKDYSLAGTLSSTGGYVPGDCAAVLRMATAKLSSKNHRVYLFSYFHRPLKASGDTTGDALDATQKAAMESYGNVLLNGLTTGGRTYKRTAPDGTATTGRVVDQYIGHRDFPR